jgi:hypothetical protein
MIVRINQFDAPRPESEAGWPGEGRLGPLLAPWPEGTRAFEVLILEQDEARRPLAEAFRQQQLRQLIPQAVAALREPGEEVVVRLDGPFAERELLPALRYLTDPDGRGRYALSPTAKLDIAPAEVMSGVRIQPSAQVLQALCGDGAVGLERAVRLRVFSVPEDVAPAIVEVDSADDERWPDLLPRVGFVLSTVRGMLALHILTARYDTVAVKTRLMQRLHSLAQQQQPARAPA